MNVNVRWTALGITIILLCLAGAICRYLYVHIQRQTARQFNRQQLTLAKAGATAVEFHFRSVRAQLRSLAKMPEVRDGASPECLEKMGELYNSLSSQLLNVGRINSKGILLQTYPRDKTAEGADLSAQKHITRLLRDHQPVTSNLFTTVQGLKAIAIHEPVFRPGPLDDDGDKQFLGSVDCLINLDRIFDSCVAPIKSGETGHAWLVDAEGQIIFHPDKEKIGSTQALKEPFAEDMLSGKEGRFIGKAEEHREHYLRDKHDTELFAYAPVHLEGTRWSIGVHAPYSEVTRLVEKSVMYIILLMGSVVVCILGGVIMLFRIDKNRIAALEAKLQLEVEIEQRAKRLEEANRKLQETQNQLVQSAKMASIGQLAAGLAHELNSPIGGSLIYIQALLKKTGGATSNVEGYTRNMEAGAGETVEEILASIEKELNRCKNIISNLLVFSRKSEREIKGMDVDKVLNDAVTLIEHQTSWQNITIKREVEPDLPKIWVDEAEIQQAFLNLLLNAVQAMKDAGTITISARRDSNDGSVELEFSDTGVGIDEKDIVNIFDPFFTTKDQGGGTGLGLFLTFGIVKKYGGAIDVESELGKGTTFTITLPVQRS